MLSRYYNLSFCLNLFCFLLQIEYQLVVIPSSSLKPLPSSISTGILSYIPCINDYDCPNENGDKKITECRRFEFYGNIYMIKNQITNCSNSSDCPFGDLLCLKYYPYWTHAPKFCVLPIHICSTVANHTSNGPIQIASRKTPGKAK